jgi:hypothetical protein
VANWRDELIEAVKTKAEREAEEAERQRKRVAEALSTAELALRGAEEALSFAHERIAEKGQSSTYAQGKLTVGALSLVVELDRSTAALKVSYLESKPREFDFARDRHIAPADVEEYVGRRIVELVRAAQKATPW